MGITRVEQLQCVSQESLLVLETKLQSRMRVRAHTHTPTHTHMQGLNISYIIYELV